MKTINKTVDKNALRALFAWHGSNVYFIYNNNCLHIFERPHKTVINLIDVLSSYDMILKQLLTQQNSSPDGQ